MWRRLFFVPLILSLPLATLAYVSPGNPSGFVNDFAGILSSDVRVSLEEKLKTTEEQTTNEIVVVIIQTLGDDTIENYAVELFREWGIGKKKNDNGVLLLVALDEREVRLEVGYGLEGALTDAESNTIIQKIIAPAFRENDYNGGLSRAVEAISEAVSGEYATPEQNGLSSISGDTIEFLFFAGIWILIWLASILGRSKSWWVGGAVGGVIGLIIVLIKGFLYIGLTSLVILVPLGFLFDYIVSKNYAKGKARGHIPWWVGGGRGGPFGGGGGFGGFGGGMSGGGGASGRW